MKAARWSISLLVCAAVAFSALELRARSGPVVVYGLVGWVVMEPDEAKPERVQIHGVFSVIEGYGAKYSPAQKGYLYYEIDQSPNGIQAARAIVDDLRKVTRTGEAIGFGGGWWSSAGGKVRKASDKPKNPDKFPIGNPVTRLGSSRPEMVAQLKAAQEAR
jgi:hypothetical protein